MNRKAYLRELITIYDSIPENKKSDFMSTYLENEKNPVLAFGWNAFLGYLGADKFYLGSAVLGILKLITFGGFGIWVIIDWFTSASTARDVSIKYARTLAQQFK